MAGRVKVTGSTIPYQLRPHKAIERNLFLMLLRKLDRVNGIELSNYRYVGFGAAFLEDFKALHSELGIEKMHCIEMDEFAFSRQQFNKPFDFIELYETNSTAYINDYFKEDCSQIVWWDYAAPKYLRESLNDIELTAQKVNNLDILKFTFNADILSFINTQPFKKREAMMSGFKMPNYKGVLNFIKADDSLVQYWPEHFTAKDIEADFSAILRALALRAVRRGLKKSNADLKYYHLSSFTYADGAEMTTVTGIVCTEDEHARILEESGLANWEFYKADTENELIQPFDIKVPAMTIAERAEIDKKIHTTAPDALANELVFKYGTDADEHLRLIEGYCKYYRYLPYYSKVIY